MVSVPPFVSVARRDVGLGCCSLAAVSSVLLYRFAFPCGRVGQVFCVFCVLPSKQVVVVSWQVGIVVVMDGLAASPPAPGPTKLHPVSR